MVRGASLGTFRHGTYPSFGDSTHAGVDLISACGTSVRTFADGVVVDVVSETTDPDFNSLGYAVLIAHESSLEGWSWSQSIPYYTFYLHLQGKPSVKVGEAVFGGETAIGQVGETGMVDGCHVHFEMRKFPDRFYPYWGTLYGNGDQQNLLEDWIDPLRTFRRQILRDRFCPRTGWLLPGW